MLDAALIDIGLPHSLIVAIGSAKEIEARSGKEIKDLIHTEVGYTMA